MPDAAGAHKARHWHRLEDGRIQCDLCPRSCKLHDGQRAACFVRAREGDRLVLTAYGRAIGLCLDPIEKKPLFHFLPGTPVLSFGTAGCNLACKFCAPRGKQSSIGHSAFLALALSRSEFPDKIQRLAPLIDGILRQQRKDGSYNIFFDAEPDSGEELYPAEAMLSLLEAYRLTRDARYLDSVERSFVHYKRAYYDRGQVQPDLLVFFANWQSQAGRLLFEATTSLKVKDLVRAFLFELHDLVIEGRRTGDYRRCVLTALGFLMRAQRNRQRTGRLW
jgi:hypothetical protein